MESVYTLEQLREQQDNYSRKRERQEVETSPEAAAALKAYALHLAEKNRADREPRAIGQILEARRNKRRRAPIRALIPWQDAKIIAWKCYKEVAAEYRFSIELSETAKRVLRTLTLYFSGNSPEEAAAAEGVKLDAFDFVPYDPYKGIFLWGPTGTGKTKLMEVFRKFTQVIEGGQFLINSVPRIYDDALEAEKFSVSQYYNGLRCLDDVGYHPAYIQDFGNYLKPADMILNARYDKFSSFGLITHATTNLPIQPGEAGRVDGIKYLSDTLDGRLISRLYEMFNIILLNGRDFRKGK